MIVLNHVLFKIIAANINVNNLAYGVSQRLPNQCYSTHMVTISNSLDHMKLVSYSASAVV
jgi:hypothetical protein